LQGLDEAQTAAEAISATAKAMQFKVARIAARRRADPCSNLFDVLERNYDMVIAGLERALR
jgi:hypothetical protein